MINFSPVTSDATGTSLSLVKFLLPLDHDALSLPATLTLIDAVCHRGALAHEVVAVDDASGDGTAAEARRFAHVMPLWLIRHRAPMGRGIAFRSAVEAACRDACDEDLLVPIDPRHRPDPAALLSAIRAAREGSSAVLVPSGRVFGRDQAKPDPDEVAVYRAGLIKNHLERFLATAATDDADAVRQLEEYFLSVGVQFCRLPAPPSGLVLLPVPVGMQHGLRIGGGRG